MGTGFNESNFYGMEVQCGQLSKILFIGEVENQLEMIKLNILMTDGDFERLRPSLNYEVSLIKLN